jgi:hypothetical protein
MQTNRTVTLTDVFGVPTNLIVTTDVTGDTMTMTTSLIMPYMEWDDERGAMNVWAPPLEPLPPTKEERMVEFLCK